MRKEKFIYETPEVELVELNTESFICTSNSNSTAGEGVITDDDDYGRW